MYIHIGNYKIISDKILLGIFNSESLKLSSDNDWINRILSEDDKSVIIDKSNIIITSNVSSFTIIKRTKIDTEDFVWRKGNE